MSNNDFKSGDIAIWNSHDSWFTEGEKYILREVRLDGTVSVYDNEGDLRDRLLCEFLPVTQSHGPIKTETRRVLKPGVYGRLEVDSDTNGYIYMKLTGDNEPLSDSNGFSLSASDLDNLSLIASQLAEFLRGQE